MHLGRNRRCVPLLTVYGAMGFGFHQHRIMGKIGHLVALAGICEFHLSYFFEVVIKQKPYS